MSIIVTDSGFAPAGADSHFLDIDAGHPPTDLADELNNIEAIRIEFASFADGRGFTLARQLRLMGFGGRLRARGQIMCEQYAMARRAGFDEVEISDADAVRQPQENWLARANWAAHDYQSQLRRPSS